MIYCLKNKNFIFFITYNIPKNSYLKGNFLFDMTQNFSTQKLVYFILFGFYGMLFSFNIKAENVYLVSYTKVKSFTESDIKTLWKKHHIPKIVMPIHHSVDVYEIIYKAPWMDSSMINCSGLYYVPKGKGAMPYMMYGHGTQIEKKRVVSEEDAQQSICLGFATDGYLSCYPDYYGIGKGEKRHLYQHAWSEAMSFIYMLYAIDELNKELHIKTNGQLFLTGYSQGGHASFAAQKYLEELNDPRFQVTASSPMSGAYDMTGEQEKYMFQPYPRQFYLPYLLISYQIAYHIMPTNNIYTIFKSPFDTILPKYFEVNENKTLYDLNKILPPIPKDVVLDSLVNAYQQDNNFLFKEKLRENNLTNWVPKAPVQLCYCKGDREVNFENSIAAYDSMTVLGAKNIKLNNLSDHLDHNTCAPFAVLATKYFFDRFKKKGENKAMKDVPKFKLKLVGIVKKKEEQKYMLDKKDRIRY